MLSRKFRASRSDVENTIKSGTTIPGIFLYAKVSKKDAEKPGFAIIISKKIEKTSVGRHRLKRKISASIENNLSKMEKSFKKTILFFPRKIEKAASYLELKKDTEGILKKSGFFS